MSNLGYELLDKKRSVLIHEIMELNGEAQKLQESINQVFAEAYASLQKVNIELGIGNIERVSYGVPKEESIQIRFRSVMGVEVPIVTNDAQEPEQPYFGFMSTSSALDEALFKFIAVKELIIKLSMIENAVYRLAVSIKKTQKRANALKNITIPKYEGLVKQIEETLDERERDEFTRLKVIKKTNASRAIGT